MSGFTRRQLGKYALAGATAATALKGGRAEAARIPRNMGVTLTGAWLSELQNAVNLGGYSIIKVITEWGLFDSGGIKSPTNIKRICDMTPYTLVRTFTGDRGHIDPNRIVGEIAPWYNAKSNKANLFIELGNEPNTWCPDPGSHGDPLDHWRYHMTPAQQEQFMWENRYFLNEAITVCRNNFPQAKIVCTSLAPRTWLSADRFLELLTRGPAPIPADRCDFMAVHFYTYADWYGSDDMKLMVPLYQKYASGKSWILTEFGMNCLQPSVCDDYTKGYRMAGMMHYSESNPVLPGNVWGGTYFHLNTPQRNSDGYAYYYPNGDWNYRERYNRGS